MASPRVSVSTSELLTIRPESSRAVEGHSIWVNMDLQPLTRVCRRGSPCDAKNQTCYIPASMSTSNPISQCALGNTDAEHERLIRQPMILAPLTERFFRQAGIGPGQRVLDLGSGVGDVAMLAARLVGPAGEVVGVERDARSIARARNSRGRGRPEQCDLHPIRCAATSSR